MEDMKVIEVEGYKSEYVEREQTEVKEKKKLKQLFGLDILDYCMLGTSIGVIVGVAFLIVGLM